jgi:hypothetical protein
MTSEAASNLSTEPREGPSWAIVALGYLLAVAMPFAGMLVGAITLTRRTRRATLHGALILAASVLVLACGAALLPTIVDSTLTGARQRAERELREVQAQTQREDQHSNQQLAEQLAKSRAEEHATLARLRREGRESHAAPVRSGS